MMVQICTAVFTALLIAEDLALDFDPPHVPDDFVIRSEFWHSVLRSFVGLNTLRVDVALPPELSRALGADNGQQQKTCYLCHPSWLLFPRSIWFIILSPHLFVLSIRSKVSTQDNTANMKVLMAAFNYLPGYIHIHYHAATVATCVIIFSLFPIKIY